MVPLIGGLSTRPEDVKRRAADIAEQACTNIGLWVTESMRIAHGHTKFGEHEDDRLRIVGTDVTVTAAHKPFVPVTFEQWLPCMLVYSAHMMAAHMALSPGIVLFINMVTGWHQMGNRKIEQILMLERVHRQAYAARRLAWGQRDQDALLDHMAMPDRVYAHAAHFDSSSTRAPRERKGPKKDAAPQRGRGGAAAPGGPGNHGNANADRPCFDWNGTGSNQTCNLGDGCRYRHACLICSGAHALRENAACLGKYTGMRKPTLVTKQ